MDTYLFIDGGYLMRQYSRLLFALRRDEKIDFRELMRMTDCRKGFYYDCIDTKQKKSETPDEREKRVREKRAFLNEIRETPGMHVIEGEMSGQKKNRRQKGVDVALAVDMLNHAVRHNMTRTVLISGDNDFTPLVKAVAQYGTYTVLFSRRHTTSIQLIRAADEYRQMTLDTLCELTVGYNLRRLKDFPLIQHIALSAFNSHMQHGIVVVEANGDIALRDTKLAVKKLLQQEGVGRRRSQLAVIERDRVTYYCFDQGTNDSEEIATLERYVTESFGKITWE